MGGAYWFIFLGSVFGLIIQVLGWRGAKLPFHFLLSGWFLLLAGEAIFLAIHSPESYRFRGDTLGIDISLTWIGPLLFSAAALAAVWWSWTDLVASTRLKAASWNRENTWWLAGLLALLPVQFVLLRTGSPHGLTDQIGVILTIIQWFAIGPIVRSVVSESDIKQMDQKQRPRYKKL